MKRLVRIGTVWLLCGMLLTAVAAASGGEIPAWEKYTPRGEQLDDTDYRDILAWLLIPGNREAALPNAAGQEVLASVIVENARSLVGKYPYVYGGESPEEGGFDCTGLVWYVYNRMSGLDITLSQAGRSKAALAAAGEKIYDHDAFLPGDVIQFTYAHVAIYVGGGRVVHARTTGTMIQETDLNYNNVEYAVRYPGVVQSEILVSGSAGQLTWKLRRDGEMTVSGSGTMPNCADDASVPWNAYREQIVAVRMDSTVTSVGDFAFYNCKNLVSVHAPGASSVGMAAFYDCAALEELALSDCVTDIGLWAFCRCVKLTELTFSEGLVRIDGRAFFGCKALARVTLPESLTVLGDGAFENCSALTSITIPDGVTSIGESMFTACRSLAEITLGGGITSIGEYAFYGCGSLAAVTIPVGVTSIGEWAFASCTALSSVTYGGLAVQWTEIEFGSGNEPLLAAALTCTGMPDAPQATLTLINRTVTLRWDAVVYAEKYQIWRSVGDGVFELLGETEDTAFCDTESFPGKSRAYAVLAVSGDAVSEQTTVLIAMEPLRFFPNVESPDGRP